MTLLSVEEIDKLKEIHPQKKTLRYIFLFAGTALIIIGLILFVIGFDFGVAVDDINLSFMVDILMIVAGMILASKFFIAPYYLRENSLTLKKLRDLREPIDSHIKFNSFSTSRLLAALLLIVIGFVNYAVFGAGIGHHETNYGNFFVLGGPSFFYATGLPALIIGFSLLLYVILSLYRGTYSQSENFYFFHELRPACPWLTEVPKKDIEAIRYQNTEIGPKPAWVMLFLPFIVMQLQTAIPLFFNNERAAPLYALSWTLLFTSIVEIFVLLILIFYHQDYYEIATKDMLYEMWFSPIRLKHKEELREEIRTHLNCGIDDAKDPKMEKKESDLNQPLFADVSNTHFQLFDLIFGVILVISAIVMLTQMVLFGPLFWWVALMYGVILLMKAVNYDFSRDGEDKFFYDDKSKIFKFQRKFGHKFHYISALNVEDVKVRKWFRKLDFFDIFGLGGMIIMLIVQQIEGWAIADTTGVIVDNIISTTFMAVLFLFMILYLFLPIDVIEFKTPSITYRIRITLDLKGKSLFEKYKTNLKGFFKEIRQADMKKTFRLRFLVFLILTLGASLYTIINLISYFS